MEEFVTGLAFGLLTLMDLRFSTRDVYAKRLKFMNEKGLCLFSICCDACNLPDILVGGKFSEHLADQNVKF